MTLSCRRLIFLSGLILAFPGVVLLVEAFALRGRPQAVLGSAMEGESQIEWSSIGPTNVGGEAGKVNAFAYVESNPQIMYIGAGWGNTPKESPSQSGIYRTSDGGAHWTAANMGLRTADGAVSSVVNSLWLDQSRPSVVLASTEFGGIFKSSDGGSTWHNVDRSEATRISQGSSGVFVASRKGVLLSTDDGDTWTVSLPLTNGATTVEAIGTIAYAGSTDGDVYGFSGSTWAKLGHPGTGAIHDLAVDPFNTQTVYAGVDDKNAWNEALHASVDGGVRWTLVNCQCFAGAQAIAFSQVTPHRLFLGDDGKPTLRYLKADGNPHPAIHDGASYVEFADVRYVVVAPATSSDDACYSLTDQGLSFAPKCSSGESKLLSKHVDNTLAFDVTMGPSVNPVYVTLQDNGSTYSANRAASWKISAGADFEGAEAVYHWDNSGYCYYVHPQRGLFISKDNCAAFNYVVPPHFFGFESLAFDRTNPDVLYAVTGENFGKPTVSKSVDKGHTWNPTKWHFRNPYQVVVAPTDATNILVATGTASTPSSLFYTHDGGRTWNQSSGLPNQQQDLIIGFPVHQFYAAFDPLDDENILLADRDPTTENVLMYRSADGGQTFSLVQTLVQPPPPRPWPLIKRSKPEERLGKGSFYYATRFFGNRVAFNPSPQKGDPDVVVTTRFGAFLSTDLGSHWKRIDTNAVAHHFVGATWNQGYLYLASFGRGVIRSTAPIQP